MTQTEHIPFCLLSRECFLADYLREVKIPFRIIPWRFASRGWNVPVLIGRLVNALGFYRILRAARRFDPDIIEGDINDYSLLRILARFTRASIVCRVRSHDVLTRDLSDSVFVDKFIPLSHRLAEPLRRAGIPDSKIEIINDGVDVRYFTAEQRESPATLDFRVGIVGRIEPFKRTLECLRIAYALKTSDTPISFWFIGGIPRTDYYEEVLATRRRLGLESICHFLPEQSDLREFYETIDALLTLSGGSVMLEAMAMGKPVVAAALPSPPEHTIVKHGETGLLYGYDDLAGVAEGLRTLAHSPDRGRSWGQAGRRKASESFDIEDQIRKTLGVYQVLIRNPASLDTKCQHQFKFQNHFAKKVW